VTNMAQQSPLQVLMLVGGMWLALQSSLRFGGTMVTTIVVGVAGLVSWTIYVLRHDRGAAASWFARSWTQPWFKLVCQLSQQQLPNDIAVDGSSSALQLKSSDDFVWCARKLKESVFGHDSAVDAMLKHLQTTVRLRAHRSTSNEGSPLGTFLFVGENGIGKKWLAANVGQRLFRSTEVLALSMSNYADEHAVDRLFGTDLQEGLLVMALRRQPCLTVVLEDIESAHPAVHETLRSVMQHGLHTRRGSDVLFENALLICTTCVTPDAVNHDKVWGRDELIDFLGQAANCSRTMLSSLTDCLHLKPLGDLEKAQVMIQLMTEECSKYGLKLEYVDPEVVFAEVEEFSPELGFEHSQQRVVRWLRNVIHEAKATGAQSLVLTERLAQQARHSAATHVAAQKKAARRGVA